jgi:hypothetical protein
MQMMTKERPADILENKMNDNNYSGLLDKSLKIFFMNAAKTCVRNPGQAYAFLSTVLNQRKAARIRANYAKEGIHVPPMMIFSGFRLQTIRSV